MAPYHVTKMTLQAMGAIYDRLSRIDYKNLNYDRVLAKFNTLYQSLKATPEEEFVRRGTALGVQLVLDSKITNQFNQLAKTAMAKASARVHDIESKLAWAHSVEDAAKTQQKIPVRNSHLAPEAHPGKAEGLEFSVNTNNKSSKFNAENSSLRSNQNQINNLTQEVKWTNHNFKHVPKNNVSWKEIVKNTKTGPAKYKHDINIEQLERSVWQDGIPVTHGKSWKVKKFDYVVGAKDGAETNCMRVEMSANTIHGHPITINEYNRYLKE